MNKKLPVSRRGNIPPFIVMDVLRAANNRQQETGDVIHLEVGQPATPAPDKVREAAARALQDQPLGYTDAMGIMPLRERIARHYAQKYALDVNPERIVITTGSSAGFVLAFLACFDEGDHVVLPSPGYPCYRHLLTSFSINPVILPSDTSTRWMPTPGTFGHICDDIHTRTGQNVKGLVMASPANPTGTALKADTLAGLVHKCQERKVRFISDEIYHGLSYEKKDHTALEFDDQVIIINSFSKYYSMTGWRIGWMVLPENLVRPVERLMQNLFISAPSLSQYAALAAFEATDQLEAWKKEYARNRKFLIEELPQIGLPLVVPPDGAFYIYMNVSHLTPDSHLFCNTMLKETGIAMTPGTDFDAIRGHEFIRLSYAGTHDHMHEAVKRLKAWL